MDDSRGAFHTRGGCWCGGDVGKQFGEVSNSDWPGVPRDRKRSPSFSGT